MQQYAWMAGFLITVALGEESHGCVPNVGPGNLHIKLAVVKVATIFKS